jgi:hypothetical protein
METREDTVPFADMVGAFVIDDRSPEVPSRASLEDCDAPRARQELIARMRRGPMTLRERAAAMIAARDLALDGHEDALMEVVCDASVSLPSRSCALVLLLFTPAGADLARSAHARVGEADWVALQDEKLTLELALQMPAPGMADSLATQLLRVAAPAREEVWTRIERCRRDAGLPALAAWRRAVTVDELTPLHDRMTAAIIDEAGHGAAVVLDMLLQTADSDEARRSFGRAVANLAAKDLVGHTTAAQGVTHRLEVAGEPVRWLVCVPHPGAMTLVAQAEETVDGGLQVNEIVVLPSEPHVNLSTPRDVLVTMNYRVMSPKETRERAVAATRKMLETGAGLPHELCLLLCLLDGMPSGAASAPGAAALD